MVSQIENKLKVVAQLLNDSDIPNEEAIRFLKRERIHDARERLGHTHRRAGMASGISERSAINQSKEKSSSLTIRTGRAYEAVLIDVLFSMKPKPYLEVLAELGEHHDLHLDADELNAIVLHGVKSGLFKKTKIGHVQSVRWTGQRYVHTQAVDRNAKIRRAFRAVAVMSVAAESNTHEVHASLTESGLAHVRDFLNPANVENLSYSTLKTYADRSRESQLDGSSAEANFGIAYLADHPDSGDMVTSALDIDNESSTLLPSREFLTPTNQQRFIAEAFPKLCSQLDDVVAHAGTLGSGDRRDIRFRLCVSAFDPKAKPKLPKHLNALVTAFLLTSAIVLGLLFSHRLGDHTWSQKTHSTAEHGRHGGLVEPQRIRSGQVLIASEHGIGCFA